MLTVHANPNPASRAAIPYLLEVQADLLDTLGTRVVVPLYLKAKAPAANLTRLSPLVTFQGETYVAMVTELAGVARRALGPPVGELPHPRAEILAALDLLFTGI